MQTTTLYDQDFYAWTQLQAELLRSGKLNDLDIVNLVEEIESLGRQKRQELRNRLGVLLGHLLKWQYQPEARSRSWFYTIKEQRERIDDHLAKNPSLKPDLPEAIAKTYKYGLNLVGKKRPSTLCNSPNLAPSLMLKSSRNPLNWSRSSSSHLV